MTDNNAMQWQSGTAEDENAYCLTGVADDDSVYVGCFN
jgi:hypothetical protein